jgi:hypothetical protein
MNTILQRIHVGGTVAILLLLAAGCRTVPEEQPMSEPTDYFTARLKQKEAFCMDKSNSATETAVLNGLRWLARHQSPDGSWDSDRFRNQCKDTICEGPGLAEHDAGVTGLALLAFTGAGYTDTSTEKFDHDGHEYCFGAVVKNAAKWLLANQDKDGCVGGRQGAKFVYDHAIATQALCDLYGMTGRKLYREPAQKAVDFLSAARNPWKAWRYGVQPGDNDTSVTGWAVYALKTAEAAGFEVKRSGYAGAIVWLDEVTDDTYYRVGYTAKGSGKVIVPGKNDKWAHHEALTAIGIMCRMLIQQNKVDPRLEGGLELLLQDLPSWDNSRADDKMVDFYYWYWGTMAVFRHDGWGYGESRHGRRAGKFWKGWSEAVKAAIVPNQKTEKDRCADGSWDADGIDRWGFEGGRVYGTALNVLTLETPYRQISAGKGLPPETPAFDGGEKRIRELIAQIEGDDIDAREAAANELIHVIGWVAAPAISEAIEKSEDPCFLERAHMILWEIGSGGRGGPGPGRRCYTDIAKLLKHEKAEVRASAAKVLAGLGASSYADKIVELLKDADAGVRNAAEEALKLLNAGK